MNGIRICSNDRLDVEMVKELRKMDKNFVVLSLAGIIFAAYLNGRINAIEKKIENNKRKPVSYKALSEMYDEIVKAKENSKED